MERKAGRLVKFLYCLTLVAIIVPAAVVGTQGMVSLATGGGLISDGPIVALLFTIGILYRIFQVLRIPTALDIFISSMWIGFLRKLGICLMVVGLTTSISILFVKPLTLALFSRPGDSGIAYFVVGVYLYVISLASWLGIILFEISRVSGRKKDSMKKQNKENP